MFACKKSSQPEQSVERSQAAILEEQILQNSGLEIAKDLHIFDVPIDFEGDNFIHTYRCGDENKEDLVLIHGFGGCSVLYYQMLKDLATKYRVFCIDLLGMGLSSRPEFKCTTTEETIAYFVDSIEKWREALNIEKFNLAGHSFGGYMSAQYAAKYQSRVQKLFLLSPAGVTKHGNTGTLEEFMNGLGFFRRQFFKLIKGFWDNKTTPGEYIRNHPIIGKYLLRRYLNGQYGKVINDEKLIELMHKFFMDLAQKENGSDKSLFYILKPPRAQGIQPLEDLIVENIQVPIVCIYGDRDWMDQTGAKRIEMIENKNFKLRRLENSGHQVTMHNPIGLSEFLIDEYIV